MSARDRLVLFGLACVAVLAAAWMLAVSPARKQASAASAEVEGARTQLIHARDEAAEARNVLERYRKAYASLASLGTAVPTSQEVPALMYALDHAANHHKVEFSSITNGGGGGSGGSRSGGSSSSSSSSSAAASAGSSFTQMPFTFVFTGGYEDLIRLLVNLEGFTVQSTGGSLHVNGRLLTIQSIQLNGGGSSSGSGSGSGQAAAQQAPNQMSWTINASAYALAPSTSTTAPGAGVSSTGSGTPTSSAGGSPAVATPAVVRAGG